MPLLIRSVHGDSSWSLFARRPSGGRSLFQGVNSAGTEVTGRALNRYNAWAALRKRAITAAFLTQSDSHLAGNRHHDLPGKRWTVGARHWKWADGTALLISVVFGAPSCYFLLSMVDATPSSDLPPGSPQRSVSTPRLKRRCAT
jgi:hypothetical protein